MTTAVITANMGGFDKEFAYAEQSVPYDFYKFTDANYPPRLCSMMPRLQARLVKIFGWQMIPEHDYYIWVDSSLMLSNPDSIKWFVEQCEGVDMAFFKHPDRNTIKEEYEFVKSKIRDGNKYLRSRYLNETFDEQMAEIFSDKGFTDNLLIASSAFIYRNNPNVREMMKEWWYHTSRYNTEDQLGLPYVLWKYKCSFKIIAMHYMKNPYLTYVRNKK